jgi:transmembrane sensor
LGKVRDQEGSLEDATWADERLVDALRETIAERDANRDVQPTAAQSARMWRAIETEMEPAPSPSLAAGLSARLTAVWQSLARPAARRAAVAAVVLAAMAAALVLLPPTGPERVAVAGTRMQTYVTPGSTTVRLRPHSALYRVPTDTASRYRLRGEAYFAVPPRTDTPPFEVRTDDARVRVLGTRFVVRTWGAGTEVYLEEGRLRMTAQAPRPSLRLTSGQRASVSPEGRVTSPTAAPRSLYLGWLDRTLNFERRPLRKIVDELEHHYYLAIRIPERLASQTLTGQISLGDRAQSLHDLAVVLGGRFERIDDDSYRFVAQ